MAQGIRFDIVGQGPVWVQPDWLVFAGFASRDPAAAEHHRLELKERGVVVPDKIPVCYVGLPATLSQSPTIATAGRPLMGEVEFVVMDTPSGVLLATGVDLFDEEIEHSDIERSKTTCATPIARGALRLDAVAKRWDDFRIWMKFDGRLVQDGAVADMMEPHKLLELAAASRPRSARAVLVYSGSMPYLEAPRQGFTHVEFGIEGKDSGERVVHEFRLERG